MVKKNIIIPYIDTEITLDQECNANVSTNIHNKYISNSNTKVFLIQLSFVYYRKTWVDNLIACLTDRH